MLSFLFPKRCLLCHAFQAAPPPKAGLDGLCAGCAGDLRRLYPDAAAVCPLCALPSAAGAVCGACQKRLPPHEGLWASLAYRAPLVQMVHQWKHLGDSAMLRPLAALMADNPPPWLDEAGIDTLLAMPLSRERRLFRGFNQSGELAAALGGRFRLPLAAQDAVSRRHRPPQSTLPRDERRRNVRGIFQAASLELAGKKVLLIDDVMTTGASVAELGRSLRRAGAAAVFVWILARNQ